MGNELARQHPLQRLLFRKVSLEERKTLVRHLLSSNFEHPFLKGETLQHAATMFTAAYPENEDQFRSTAIQLIACKYEKYCDQPFLVGMLKKQYPPSKYNELINLSEQIDTAITNGDYRLFMLRAANDIRLLVTTLLL